MMAVLKRVVAPAVVLVLALPAASAFAAPLDNDDYQDATPLEYFQRAPAADRTNDGAGIQANEPLTVNEPAPQHLCSGRRLAHSIWYQVPGSGGPVTVHTRGSAVDTVIVAYDTDSDGDNGPPSANDDTGNAINCNDDISGDDQTSELTFNTQSGVAYLVQVGACSGCHDASVPEEGTIEFVAYDAPPNDNRASAIALASGASTEGDNVGATLEGTTERFSCTVGSTTSPFAKTVWYRFRAPDTGRLVVTSSGIDTVLSGYRGTTFVGCNDDGPGQSLSSRLELNVTAGDYFIQVGGYGAGRAADFGDLTLRADFTRVIPPPSDRDGDGIPDVSDRCPDQNSAARDANRDGCLDPDLDADRDGVLLSADKCPSQNAAARDKNRDGCLDKLPPKRIKADATLKAAVIGGTLHVFSLKVSAPKGAKVTVRCGPGCKFAKKASASGKPLALAAKLVNVKKLAGRNFHKGDKIRIYVTRKGQVGAYIQYTVRQGGWKKIKRCLKPGSMKPRKRCG